MTLPAACTCMRTASNPTPTATKVTADHAQCPRHSCSCCCHSDYYFYVTMVTVQATITTTITATILRTTTTINVTAVDATTAMKTPPPPPSLSIPPPTQSLMLTHVFKRVGWMPSSSYPQQNVGPISAGNLRSVKPCCWYLLPGSGALQPRGYVGMARSLLAPAAIPQTAVSRATLSSALSPRMEERRLEFEGELVQIHGTLTAIFASIWVADGLELSRVRILAPVPEDMSK